METLRSHPGHDKLAAVQSHIFADDIRIRAEYPRPKVMAQNDRRSCTRSVAVEVREPRSHARPDLQHVEIIARDKRYLNVLRILSAENRGDRRRIAGQTRERFSPIAIGPIFRSGEHA